MTDDYYVTRVDYAVQNAKPLKLEPPGPSEEGWELHSWQLLDAYHLYVLWKKKPAE